MNKNEIHGHKVDAFNRDHVRVERVKSLGDPPVDTSVYRIGAAANEPTTINFQNGPSSSVGVNGVTAEAMLAIALDRLECFQRGAYKCRENALAITKIEEALHWLGHRSNDRERRSVDGTKEL